MATKERIGFGVEDSDVDRFWRSIDKFRGNLSLDEFRYLTMNLFFLKYSYFVFEQESPGGKKSPKRRSLKTIRTKGSDVNPEYWLSPEARWPNLLKKLHGKQIGPAIDRSMDLIRKKNPLFRGMITRSCEDMEYNPDLIKDLVRVIDSIHEDSKDWGPYQSLAETFANWMVTFSDKALIGGKSSNIAPELFSKKVEVAYSGDRISTKYDLSSFGPSYYNHPDIKPFYINPQLDYPMTNPRASFDGTNYIVIWVENHFTEGEWLMGCRVTPSGQILDPGGFPIHKKGQHLFPEIACGIDPKTQKPVYLVVWNQRDDIPYSVIRGALIRPSGKVQIVVDYRTPTLDAILTDNEAMNSPGTAIFPDIHNHFNPWKEFTASRHYYYHDVDFNGTDFVVTCMTGEHVIARLIDPHSGGVKVEQPVASNLVDPWGKPLTLKIWKTSDYYQSGYSPSFTRIASAGGSQCFVTWHKLADIGMSDLWGVKINFKGSTWTIGTPTILTHHLELPYGYCAMDSNGNGKYMLAWHDMSRAAQKKIHPGITPWPDLAIAAVYPVANKPLSYSVDPPKLLFDGDNVHGDIYPRLACDGINNLLIFNGVTSDIIHYNPNLGCLVGIMFGVYLSPDGKFLDGFYIKDELGGGAYVGDVCFGKNEGMVVYRRKRGGGPFYPNSTLEELINGPRVRIVAKPTP